MHPDPASRPARLKSKRPRQAFLAAFPTKRAGKAVEADRERYDLTKLAQVHQPLKRWIRHSPVGLLTIDFANPQAIKALNHAIIREAYGIHTWELPEDALCPGIPGRADYVHAIATLLASDRKGQIPRGPKVSIFDVGVGANCIYPIIGRGEYGWRFIGSDIDPIAAASARRIVRANELLTGLVEIRQQSNPTAILSGMVASTDGVQVVMCNPPFHTSRGEAHARTRRKWSNLGRSVQSRRMAPLTNFGGRDSELWCPGGEVGFIDRMITESSQSPTVSGWFTALLSRAAHLPAITKAWGRVLPTETRVLPFVRGQKQSRILAWSFLHVAERRTRLSTY